MAGTPDLGGVFAGTRGRCTQSIEGGPRKDNPKYCVGGHCDRDIYGERYENDLNSGDFGTYLISRLPAVDFLNFIVIGIRFVLALYIVSIYHRVHPNYTFIGVSG